MEDIRRLQILDLLFECISEKNICLGSNLGKRSSYSSFMFEGVDEGPTRTDEIPTSLKSSVAHASTICGSNEPKMAASNQNGRLAVCFRAWCLETFFWVWFLYNRNRHDDLISFCWMKLPSRVVAKTAPIELLQTKTAPPPPPYCVCIDNKEKKKKIDKRISFDSESVNCLLKGVKSARGKKKLTST